MELNNEFQVIYPAIYNNLIGAQSPVFYNVKDGFIPFNYNYGSFLNAQFNNFLAKDLNLQNLNINQIYNQNLRNTKQNNKK